MVVDATGSRDIEPVFWGVGDVMVGGARWSVRGGRCKVVDGIWWEECVIPPRQSSREQTERWLNSGQLGLRAS